MNDLETALALERRPYLRKRLLAIRAMLLGASRLEAARSVKASAEAVGDWLRLARRSGLQALMRPMPGRKRGPVMHPEAAVLARAEIRAALAAALSSAERTRFIAVDKVLAGDRLDEAARSERVTPTILRRWLARLRVDGPAGLMDRKSSRRPLLDADSGHLRSLAAKERNPRHAKRLHAMACLAEGKSAFAAGMAVNATGSTVQEWLKDFRKGGPEALNRAPTGRPPRLTAGQMAALASHIEANPSISNLSLWRVVKQKFGFDYTTQGLMRLLGEEMGFWRKGKLLAREQARD